MTCTPATRFASLQKAYDDLISGKAVAEFRDSNGESVRYTRADLTRLKNEVEAARLAATSPGSTLGGPLNVWI